MLTAEKEFKERYDLIMELNKHYSNKGYTKNYTKIWITYFTVNNEIEFEIHSMTDYDKEHILKREDISTDKFVICASDLLEITSNFEKTYNETMQKFKEQMKLFIIQKEIDKIKSEF